MSNHDYDLNHAQRRGSPSHCAYSNPSIGGVSLWCPFGVPLVPLPRRRNGPVYSRQVTIQEKCSVGFSRLARLPLQKIAVTHGGPARQCSPPSASR